MKRMLAAIHVQHETLDAFLFRSEVVNTPKAAERLAKPVLTSIAAILYDQQCRQSLPPRPPTPQGEIWPPSTPDAQDLRRYPWDFPNYYIYEPDFPEFFHVLAQHMLLVDYGFPEASLLACWHLSSRGKPRRLEYEPRPLECELGLLAVKYPTPEERKAIRCRAQAFCRRLAAHADGFRADAAGDTGVPDCAQWERLRSELMEYCDTHDNTSDGCGGRVEMAPWGLLLYWFHTHRRPISEDEWEEGLTGYTGVFSEMVAEIPRAGTERLRRKLMADVKILIPRYIRQPECRQHMYELARRFAREHGITSVAVLLDSDTETDYSRGGSSDTGGRETSDSSG